eukprot:6487594-Amphidinium_carterae.4
MKSRFGSGIQWLPAYGFKTPHYSSISTPEDCPNQFFQSPHVAREPERTIPDKLDFEPLLRPISDRWIIEDFDQMSEGIVAESVRRKNQGLFRSDEHVRKAQTNLHKSQRDWRSTGDYWREVERTVYTYQQIDLVTSLKCHKKMAPQDAVFKSTRCKGMVEAFENLSDEEIVTALAFEGQEHMSAIPVRGSGEEDEMEDHPYRDQFSHICSRITCQHLCEER